MSLFIYFNIVFTLLIIVYFIFLNRKGESSWNRFILLTMPLLSFGIVFFKTSVVQPEVLPVIYLPEANLTETSLFDSTSNLNYWLIAYLIGLTLSLGYHFLGILKVNNLIKRSELTMEVDGISVYKSEVNGAFLNNVFLTNPNDEIVLTHELAHVKQKHSLDRIFAMVLQAILWFNPFVYVYNRMIAENHEFLADEKVLEKEKAESYATYLMNQTMRTYLFESLNPMSKMSKLKIRVMKMYEKSKLKKGWYLVVPVMTTALLSFTLKEVSPSGIVDVVNEIKTAEDSIVEAPDTHPEFEGGQEAMFKYIAENVKYPENAMEAGEEGKVFVECIVEKDGSISGTNVLRGVSAEIDKEAIRVMNTMPKWKPAQLEGKNVRSVIIIPINFVLSDKSDQE
jgi:TonB family protein